MGRLPPMVAPQTDSTRAKRTRPASTAPRQRRVGGETLAAWRREAPSVSRADLFPAVRLVPVLPRSSTQATFIPRDGAASGEVDFQPVAPNAPGPTGSDAAPMADGCDIPRSMHKVTSGPFLNGLRVGSYYPDLAQRGYPANAGPFDLGNRAGSAVQLYGVIPSPCEPSRFSLGQSATATRVRINGVANALEGTTFDDTARSGRDTTQPPFRQEFLGGGSAPLGYIISFCDPPSMPYSASTASAEFDVNFTSTLTGPGGSRSVNWSISVRIASGSVTRNTLS
jgi:hypothetical protein